MSFIANTFFFLFTLGVAIIFHEFGHFIVGRWCGVKVLRFSVGFGKPIWTVKRGDTEYCLAPIPLGGYVKFAGDSVDEELEGKPWEFLSAAAWKRILIVVAGPFMNIVLAFLLYYGILMLAGEKFIQTTAVGTVLDGYPAAVAGLKPGDRILEINGRPVGGEDARWDRVENAIAEVQDLNVHLEIERPGESEPFGLDVILQPLSKRPLPPMVWVTLGNSPAHRAGMRHGDVIETVAGTPVSSWQEMSREVSAKFSLQETDSGMRAVPIPFELKWRSPNGNTGAAVVTPDVTLAKDPGGERLAMRTGLEPPALETVLSASPTVASARLPGGGQMANGGEDALLVEVDGVRVRTWQDVFDAVADDAVVLSSANILGGRVSVRWLADGEIHAGSVTLTPSRVTVPPSEEYRASIGIFAPHSFFESMEQRGIAALGIAPDRPLKVGRLTMGSAGKRAGMKKGDILLAVNGEPVGYIEEVIARVMGQFRVMPEGGVEALPVHLTWRTPAGEVRNETVMPDVDKSFFTTEDMNANKQRYFARLGIQFDWDREYYGLVGAVGAAGRRVQGDFRLLGDTFKRLITREYTVRSLAGPIGIFQISGKQGAEGLETFLVFVAMLSVNLAVLNLLPIPILDGGHLVIYTLEILRRRQLSRLQLEWAHRIAFFGFLLPLLIAVFYVDLERLGLFSGIGDLVKQFFR